VNRDEGRLRHGSLVTHHVRSHSTLNSQHCSVLPRPKPEDLPAGSGAGVLPARFGFVLARWDGRQCMPAAGKNSRLARAGGATVYRAARNHWFAFSPVGLIPARFSYSRGRGLSLAPRRLAPGVP